MNAVTRETIIKSGDEFIRDEEHKVLYTLQKLPDFPLWILISEYNEMWMKPMDNPFKAFGGWHQSFLKVK